MKQNVFLKYIQNGRIRSLEDLRRMYRRLAVQTHPDQVGSDRLSEKFIEFRVQYEDAKRILEQMTAPIAETYVKPSRDVREAFYRQLQIVERIDSPFNFRWKNDTRRIRVAKEAAYERFRDWQNGLLNLYKQANSEYDKLKREKPLGPYRKDALYHNLNPIFHNIAAYNVNGNEFYHEQMKRNLSAVLKRLEERHLFALRDYVLFLIADCDREPAKS